MVTPSTLFHMGLLRLALGFICLLGIPFVFAARQEPLDTLDKICSAWKAKQDAVSTLRYAWKGKQIYIRGEPEKEYRCPIGVNWLLDFKNNRVKKTADEFFFQGDATNFSPCFTVWLFDGVKYQHYYPRQKNTSSGYTPPPQIPDLTETEPKKSPAGLITPRDFPLFVAHGIIPTNLVVPRLFGLTIPIEKAGFIIQGDGKCDGHDCVILKSATVSDFEEQYEYWVDMARQCAVLRFIYYQSHKPLMTWDIQYRSSVHGWLPASWRYVNCRFNDTVESTTEVDEVTAEINPLLTIGDFQMEPSVGMSIRFPNEKGKDLFQDQADGSLQRIDLTRSNERGTAVVFVVVVVGFVIVVCGVVVAKRLLRNA